MCIQRIVLHLYLEELSEHVLMQIIEIRTVAKS